MEAAERVRTGLGLAAVAIAVALSLVSIRVARAADDMSREPALERFQTTIAPAATARESGPACAISGPGATPERLSAATVARLRAQVAAAAAPSDQSGDVVVLNNRGYNYRRGAPTASAEPPSSPPSPR